MPSTFEFASNAQNFTQHFSSSNDSFGMFGLFYGLPSSYASSIKSQGTGPILIDTLTEQGYRYGLFSGNGFEDPLFEEAIFRNLDGSLYRSEQELHQTRNL